MIILGLDPGFANIGYSVMEVGSSGAKLLDAGVFQTEKSDKKRKVLATDDNLRRAREIHLFLVELITKWEVTVLSAEAMSFPRNASAAAKVAMCWGVIASIAEANGLAMLQASPQEVKLAVCGSKSASKEDIEKSVEARYSVSKYLTSVANSYREHPYDATAVILTALNSELVRALLTLEKSRI